MTMPPKYSIDQAFATLKPNALVVSWWGIKYGALVRPLCRGKAS